MTIRAALLARVSTPQQAKADRHGIPIQLETGRAYADRLGFDVRGEYVDQISGASESRESFYRLIAEAERYSSVIVYDLSRLARTEELAHRFLRLLHEVGLEVHSATRGLLTNDIQTGIEIALSAEERRRIASRTYAGLLAKARKGLVPTNIQLYGYRDIPGTGKVMIDPAEAEIVGRIFALAAEGATYQMIARDLNALDDRRLRAAKHWYPGHLTRIIRQSAYKGEYLWPTKSLKGTTPFNILVPAIVTKDTWEKAQKRKVGRPPRTDRPLVGHLRCGLCGSSISSTANKQNGYLYRCNRKTYPVKAERCKLPHKHGPTLEKIVDYEVRKALSDRDKLRDMLNNTPMPDDPNAKARAELAGKDARWLEAFKLGAISATELGQYRSEIRAELNALATPAREHTFPFAEFAKAARERSLKELLEYAHVTVILTQESLEVTLGTGFTN